jgi:uncharacterized protein YndB with AHSA1/START domain
MNNTLTVTTPTDREIVITRVFDAPRDLVWRATSEPALLARWLHGFTGQPLLVCENDHRAGGAFRFVWKGPHGEMSLEGVYREVVPPEPGGKGGRTVRTETMRFGGQKHGETGEKVATFSLREHPDNRSMLTLSVLFPTKAARDAAIAAGMKQGIERGYNTLDSLLASDLGA